MRLKYLCSSENPESRIWIFGLPYDGTSSHLPGARFGPDTIRSSSNGLESFSPYQSLDLRDLEFYDYGNIEVSHSSPEMMVDEVYQFTLRAISRGKRFLAIGGEHSVSYPIVRACSEQYRDLFVVYLDAHCDMRDSYGGSIYSHASVARRILEVIPSIRFLSFGARSGDADEFTFARNLPHFYPFTLDEIKNAVKVIPEDAPVYITIDLDIVDPGFFPGTGTPEPCGIKPGELLEGILAMKGLNIIGADVVEFCPPADISGASAALGAFVIRELLLLFIHIS